MNNFNNVVSGADVDEDMVKDGWTDIFRNLTANVAKQASKKLGRRLSVEERVHLMELADYQKMNQVRARVDEIVEDPVTAELLKPWYRQFCKRPCFHDEYLPTFNRPNVTLVDTDGQGVQQLTESGVVVDGKEYKVDCLVFATGFEVGTAVHPPGRLRHHRPRRDDAVAEVVGGPADAARAAVQRLPQLLLPGLHPDRGHRQRAHGPQRAGQARHLPDDPGP